MDDVFAWKRRYNTLWKENGLEQQLDEIVDDLIEAVCAVEPGDAPEPTNEPVTARSKFLI
jgi:hypothetical protein